MTWNYPDGFDPSCLDRKLDLEADSDELAKQILENEGQTAVCTLFDAVEYLYDFFNNSPIPPALRISYCSSLESVFDAVATS